MRIIRWNPSILDLVNASDTNVLFSVTFVLATMFFPWVVILPFLQLLPLHANLELDFGVSIRSSFSPFSIISRIILSLVTFFYLFKWFLRFYPLKFWESLFRIGMISRWTFKIVVVPTLLQLRLSFGIAIVDNTIVVLGCYCNFWFGCCCCTPRFDFHGLFRNLCNFFEFL